MCFLANHGTRACSKVPIVSLVVVMVVMARINLWLPAGTTAM